VVVITEARWIHIVAGVVALAVFWIPLVARKGGWLHRRAGLVYAWSMLLVVVAAVAASGWRYLYDLHPAARPRAIFLSFIALLTFASGWNGLRALRTKKRMAPSWNPIDVVPSYALALGGVALMAWGLNGGFNALAIAFGALGAALGVQQIAVWSQSPSDPRHWWYQHMRGMIGACIGTVTAFLVVNARLTGLGTFNFAVWTLPGLLGGIGIALWTRHYRRKFGQPRKPSLDDAEPAAAP
jgi:hypothetical protein